MRISVPFVLFGFALLLSVSYLRRRAGVDREDEKNIKKLLRRVYAFVLFLLSGAVGFFFFYFGPALLTALPAKELASSVTLPLFNIFGIITETASFSIVFNALFLHVALVLCFLALPMMVGLGLVLLCPVFVKSGKRTSRHNGRAKNVRHIDNSFKRTFLLFSHLRI